jgi:hypothetical protein
MVGRMRLIKLHPFTLPLFVLTLSGCEQLNQPTQPARPTVKAPRESRVPVHRFVLTRADPGAAFDTQTGQLCRTWDWKMSGRAQEPDKETGQLLQRSVGELTPTCLSLYEKYPSGVNPQSEALPDE